MMLNLKILLNSDISDPDPDPRWMFRMRVWQKKKILIFQNDLALLDPDTQQWSCRYH
jgi:hypothetical protein